MASILVIIADPNIESLLGELVAFAGHRPMYDVTAGAGGESIRRVRPDVAILDTSLPNSVVDACLWAVEEVGCCPLLMSSTASATELAQQARAEGYLYFALPSGPKPLAAILDRALAHQRRPVILAPELVKSANGHGAVRPALCAALARVARAALARPDDQRSHSALRAAITDYARQLRAEHIPIGDGLALVQDAVRDCAMAVGADAMMTALLLDTEQWAVKAYEAA